MRYAIVIWNAGTNYPAYIPMDLPRRVATGAKTEKVDREIREAIFSNEPE